MRRERKIWRRARRIRYLVRTLMAMRQAWHDELQAAAKQGLGAFGCIGVTAVHTQRMEPLERELKKLTLRKTENMLLEIANGHPTWLMVYDDEKTKQVAWGRTIDYPIGVELQVRIELAKRALDLLREGVEIQRKVAKVFT